MKKILVVAVCGLILAVAGVVNAQNTHDPGQSNAPQSASAIQRDPQAIDVLSQSLRAAGGASQTGTVHDFTATGTITHFWAGQEVKGSTTLRQRGVDHIRMDSDLPSGQRSW